MDGLAIRPTKKFLQRWGEHRFGETASEVLGMRIAWMTAPLIVLASCMAWVQELSGPETIEPKLRPFDLKQVRLLDGPFQEAMERDRFWNQVTSARCYCTGGTSNQEHWRGDPHKLADQLSDHTQETCCTYNMLKLTRHLFH